MTVLAMHLFDFAWMWFWNIFQSLSMHNRPNLQTAGRRAGRWELLHISVFTLKLLWQRLVWASCVFSPLPASSSHLKPSDWRAKKKKKSSLRDRIKGGGVPWKPGCSHQATSISSFKAWQGVVRTTEGSGGSGALGVCGRNARAWSICVWACAHTSAVCICHASTCAFLSFAPQWTKQVTHFSHALS